MKKWYEIKAQVGGVAEVWIYKEIGEGLFGEGVAAKTFVPELNAITAGQIDLHINSPGGNLFDGQAIYNALVRHPAAVTTYVDGIAASIASVIALAGDTVVMPSNAMLMIHNPIGSVLWGNSDEMRRTADVLDKVRETILNVYEEHSTKDREELAAAMDAETWLTAADAVEYGFADEVGAELKLAARYDLSHFRNAPVALATTGPGDDTPAEDTTPPEPAEDSVQVPAEGTDTKRGRVLVASRGKVLTFAPRKQ
jgi:ATP-dependent Clp protease protease subunit